jgi:hypothetical protein
MGMSRAQADEALDADVRDVNIDIHARLKESLQDSEGKPFSKRKAGSHTPGELR